jgi:tRNA threonylcarbamoyladenosine biosynthesis protein TsaE
MQILPLIPWDHCLSWTLRELASWNLTLKSGDTLFLIGDLWAGKTTLTKHILSQYGVNPAEVRSPTYTYMQEYRGTNKQGEIQTFHHFDLYRLETYDDFLNIGGQEYLENTDTIKIIEWPEILDGYFVPNYTITLDIPSLSDEQRVYSIKKHIF